MTKPTAARWSTILIDYVPLNEDNIRAVHALSNANLEFDAVPVEVFRYKTLGDPDFDPEMALVAVSDGEPCGYMMGVCRDTPDGKSAAIKMFAVNERFRGRGIASELLSRVEGAIKRAGATSLRVGFIRPNYLTPGLDPRYTAAAAFLLRRGYTRRGEAFNMDVELAASDWSTDVLERKLAADGVICRRLGVDEKQRLNDWMAADGFSEGWRYQVMHAAEQDPVGVFIAERHGEIIAFACYDGVRPGWFGPMGTTQNLRGGGVGSVTFLKCLQSMKEVGYKVCEICAVGPLYFYSKVANARVSRIFWHFARELED